MGDLVFNELSDLINCFMIGASTGIFLGFVVWCVRQIVVTFRKFF